MYGWAASSLENAFLTFGVVSVFGVILGSLIWTLITRSFRIEWFNSFKDFYMHMIGAVLMGFGGVLGLGCTIGQGVTGMSTLSLGSLITLSAIIGGAAMTMKMQYYLYDDLGWLHAFKSTLSDMVPGKGGS